MHVQQNASEKGCLDRREACLQGFRVVDVAPGHHLVPQHALPRLRQLLCLHTSAGPSINANDLIP